MSDKLKASDALAARNLAIKTLLKSFGEAVRAGQYFAEVAQDEGLETPPWELAGVEYPVVLEALDRFFPMVVRRPQVVREYWVNTKDGRKVERYISK